jgi:flagellar hook-associated protein 2
MPEIGAISFGGLASGLDTKTLISQLVRLARQPMQRLEQSRSLEEKKISAFQEFNGKLLALKTAAQKLLTPTDFFARTVTVSDDTKLGVSATSSAQTGTYTITIDELARVGQEGFVGVADKTAQNLSGTFAIENAPTNPSGFAININTSGMSLEQLRDAINNDSNNDGRITANIIDTGPGENRYRLIIKGNVVGIVNDFDITSTASLTIDSDVNITFSANDANLTIDGISIIRSNNTISDIIDGVTLVLKEKSLSPLRFTVENDTLTMQNNIKSFILAYNEIRSYIDSRSRIDQKNSQNNGTFVGDSSVRGIYERIRKLITEPVSGLSEDYNAINDLGITTDIDGKLKIDDTKLMNAISTEPDKIREIFTGNSNIVGIAENIISELTNFTDPVGGLINIRIDGLRTRITSLDDRISLVGRRLMNYEATLVRQFMALEQLISSLQAQGGALGALRIHRQQ